MTGPEPWTNEDHATFTPKKNTPPPIAHFSKVGDPTKFPEPEPGWWIPYVWDTLRHLEAQLRYYGHTPGVWPGR